MVENVAFKEGKMLTLPPYFLLPAENEGDELATTKSSPTGILSDLENTVYKQKMERPWALRS